MPSVETVERALAAIKQPAAYEYFFDQLTSPAWINPLVERGFFRQPPPGEVEGEYVRFPIWPESRYLARMASRDPELVLQVLQDIPNTDNPRVLGDMLDALLAMPPAVSVKFASRAESWVDSPYLNLVSEKLGKLAIHLAQGGYTRSALTLARALLMPIADVKPLTTDLKWTISEAKPRYDMWAYQHVAEMIVPVLATVEPRATIRLLSDLLDSTVSLMVVPDAQPPEDWSMSWRHTVEDSDQNSPVKTVSDVLIEALRDTAVKVIGSSSATLNDILSILNEHPWYIFRRLTYYLLSSYVDEGWELASEYIFEQSYFDNSTVYHEFWLLARAVYVKLEPQDQLRFVSLIEAGPTETYGDDPKRYKDIWIARRLAVLKDVLKGSALRKFNSLVTDIGFEPDHPDLLMYSTGIFVGPTSPKESGELQQMPVKDLMEFLRSWQPTGDFMDPSREGLSRSLASAVAEKPDKYADSASSIFNVSPTYLRGMIDGWTEAIRKGYNFDWAPVIAFCIRVLDQSEHGPETENVVDATSWQWVRRSITYLLLGGLNQGVCEIPATLRSRVWIVLEPLTRDVEPTPEFEEQYGGSNMDPPTLAINTTRGQAMHDVVRYALWVARFIAKANEQDQTAIGFKKMPEVRRVLDEHLDVRVEPSQAIRSVYGQWLPWLYWLDPSWLEDRVDLIFPDQEDLVHLWEAAWNTYLSYSPINDNVFELLRDQYSKAIAQISLSAESGSTRPLSSNVRVAHHLIIQYLRDRLQLDDPLIDGLFSYSDANLRRETMAHAGRTAGELAEKMPAVVSRAVQLWEVRWSRGDPRELTAFGWWFSTSVFPETWAIQQLAETLEVTQGQIEHQYAVLQRLAEIADFEPQQAVRCLRLMANVDRQDVILHGSLDKVHSILTVALASSQPGARQDALDLVHLLGARGYRGLRSLLSPEPPHE